MEFINGNVYKYLSHKEDIFKLLFNNNNNQLHSSLKSYLEVIGVTDILFEAPYIDNDFLEDYANFYAISFYPYERHCKRVHFFSNNVISDELLNDIIIGDGNKLEQKDNSKIERLQKHYLGYIVVRPFSKAKIGRTCLKPGGHFDIGYSSFFFSIRKYTCYPLGIKLTIDTMAFQEQDRTTSACASIAIWSAFHVAGKVFQRRLLAPSIVTKNALKSTPFNRSFPNHGLNAEQICTSIAHSELVPFKSTIGSPKILKGLIYAYGHCGLPIIAGLNLIECNTEPPYYAIPLRHGNAHAVTINGFSIKEATSEFKNPTDLNLFSSKIEEIFVHDDQLSPFSKMTFLQPSVEVSKGIEVEVLETGWKTGKRVKTVAIVNFVIIPLHPNIRIQFDDIYNNVLISLKILKILNFKINYEWKIKLEEVNKWKLRFIEESREIFGVTRSKILKTSYPKYIWSATAIYNNIDHFELIFDTTESKNNHCFLISVPFLKEVEMLVYENLIIFYD